MNGMSHGIEARPCHKCSVCVLVHCLAGKQHISSNAADHWQQFLHQQHFLIILPADFSARFNQNEVCITKFQYRNRDLMDLLKCMRGRRLVLKSRCLDAQWRTYQIIL